MLNDKDLRVTTLGKCLVRSPLESPSEIDDGIPRFIPDDAKVRYQVTVGLREEDLPEIYFEKAGPRETIYFEPSYTKAAIVTCGGLSPGLNNVIRSIFYELHYRYKVPEVYGFRYGYQGLDRSSGFYPVLLTNKKVDGVQDYGGTFLGTCRGSVDVSVMAETLDEMGIDILFCVGGDGTLKGAHALWKELEKRNKKISIIGVPKTIDNDISFVYKTFGFDTAVRMAKEVIKCAHVEAIGHVNGIGLVKVMGRESGFIAAYATLASLEVNFCLIPEIPFSLHGENGLLNCLHERLANRSHAVIVVAEGAGQNLIEKKEDKYDASGNRVLSDIGSYLKQEIKSHFSEIGFPVNLKFIDPSYIIRSVPANTSDSIFCENLARNAVHAAMAGKTDILIGLWHGSYTHVPLEIATRKRKKVSPNTSLWRSVLGATGQPAMMCDKEPVLSC
jgi:6-phosphofructokinase 1